MKFILTKELGRLARWLRILGYDSEFYREDNLSTLVIKALREERIILTRNSRLSRFPGPRVVRIKSDFVDKQLKQIIRDLKLRPKTEAVFTRCLICNVELRGLAKARVKDKVPKYVYRTQADFKQCPRCRKTYWPGTHWGNARHYLSKALNIVK